MNKILLVDDDYQASEFLMDFLRAQKYHVQWTGTSQHAMNQLNCDFFDIVLLDLVLPDKSGLDVLKNIKQLNSNMQIIMITGHGDVSSAVEAMKYGAFDFIEKPINTEHLLQIIQKAEQMQGLKAASQFYREEFQKVRGELIGNSPSMLEVRKLIQKVAAKNIPVLIMGETGTGKELVAWHIHQLSPRANYPFRAVNCGAIPENLIESELFGHEKGAFTDAKKLKKGVVELCHQGSLFLDEIGEMSLSAQVHLLRFLDTGGFTRVGGEKQLQVDVRTIAATNKNLEQLKDQGNFRDDLFYRLRGVPIYIPPLRERKGDIPELVSYFVQKYCEKNSELIPDFSEDAQLSLQDFDYPGNVRELKHLVEQLMIFRNQKEQITKADVEHVWRILYNGNGFYQTNQTLEQATRQSRRKHILKILNSCNGNRSQAARVLCISRTYLIQLIKELNIQDKAYNF